MSTSTCNLPLLVLYSMMVEIGRLRTFRRVSLFALAQHCKSITACRRYAPNLVPDSLVSFHLIPQGHNVLALPHTDRAPTNLRPFKSTVASIFRLVCASETCLGPGGIVRSSTTAVIKLVANDGHYQIFPESIRDALFKTNYPFTTSNVQRVFPHWSSNTRVEKQVVGRRLQG